jgi:hypothetical protein
VNTITSYSKLIVDFQRLLFRVAEHEAELPHAGQARLELEAELQKLKDIKARQQDHWWAWRQASKELQQSMSAGRYLAGRLRDAVKAAWGRFDPRLAELGVTPLRRRGEPIPKVNGSERPM